MSRARAKDSVSRIETYFRANKVKRLTPKQTRRVKHKHNHSLSSFSAATLHRHQHEDAA